MTTPVETVPPSLPLDQAAALMRTLRVHHLVVTERSEVVGVLSAADIVRHRPRETRMVSDAMSADVPTIDEDDTVRKAANLMRGRSVGCVVVMRGGRLSGIVTVSDLLDLLGKGGGARPATPARVNLHHRVPHHKQHRGRSW
jgi:CBS domain-containing protein